MSWLRISTRTAAALIAGMLLVPGLASATSCREWTRLGPDEKEATVLGMIDDALRSNRGREFRVNREAIGRCLRENTAEMVVAFDDVCSDSRKAGMDAIREVFKTYVWSCAG